MARLAGLAIKAIQAMLRHS